MYNIYTEYSSSFSGFMSKTNMRHTGLIYVSSKGNVLICVASEFTLISSNNYCIYYYMYSGKNIIMQNSFYNCKSFSIQSYTNNEKSESEIIESFKWSLTIIVIPVYSFLQFRWF